MGSRTLQCCAVCAWRETCAKKFCVPDGGAHCPDFTRDVSIRHVDERESGDTQDKEESGEDR